MENSAVLLIVNNKQNKQTNKYIAIKMHFPCRMHSCCFLASDTFELHECHPDFFFQANNYT